MVGMDVYYLHTLVRKSRNKSARPNTTRERTYERVALGLRNTTIVICTLGARQHRCVRRRVLSARARGNCRALSASYHEYGRDRKPGNRLVNFLSYLSPVTYPVNTTTLSPLVRVRRRPINSYKSLS